MKTRRRGGKKLGEGKYGFVVDPAVACEGKDAKEYVSKIFKTKEAFDKVDRKVIETIKTIPDYEKYFILPEFCENVGELSEDNKKDGVTEDNKRNGYLMKRGEETLATRISVLIDEENDGRDSYPPNDLRNFMIHDLKDLFYGLHLLHEKNILHGDLHSENVIVNWVPGKISGEWVALYRFIDFDRAFFITEEAKKKMYIKKDWNHIPTDNELKSKEFTGLITEIVQKLKLEDEIWISEKIHSMLGSRLGSRTGGAARRSSRRTRYRSRKAKGSSRR